MVTLNIIRQYKSTKSSIGKWYFEKKPLSLVSIEDRDRGIDNSMTLEQVQKLKVYGVTCIGIGEYNITILDSKRFNEPMLHITPTMGFGGILIHIANKPEDIEGCVGVAKTYDPKKPDWVSGSTQGLIELYSLLGPIMGFTYTLDKKGKPHIKLPQNFKQKEQVKLIIEREYVV